MEAGDAASHFALEIRSLNNRYLDIQIKLPRGLAVLESRVKKTIQERFSRGRFDVSITRNSAHESAAPHIHSLPPVNITAPEATPPKRVARPKPAQNRGTVGRIAARSNQPVAGGAGGVTPGASSDGAAALQPTAASAMRISGAEVNWKGIPRSQKG